LPSELTTPPVTKMYFGMGRNYTMKAGSETKWNDRIKGT
jgi:hypothetical protein